MKTEEAKKIDAVNKRDAEASAHVLDLRGRHRPSQPLVFHESWFSRAIDAVRRWWARNEHQRATLKASLAVSLPSFQAGDDRRARIMRALERELSVVLLGYVLFRLAARVERWFTAQPPHRALWRMFISPYTLTLWLRAMARYAYRRAELALGEKRVPRLMWGQDAARHAGVFVAVALIIVIPISVAAIAGGVPDKQEAIKEAHTVLQDASDALFAMQRGEWAAATVAWRRVDATNAALGEATMLTEPIVGWLAPLLSPKAAAAKAVLETIHGLASAGVAFSAVEGVLGGDAALTRRVADAGAPLEDAANALTEAIVALNAIDSVTLSPDAAQLLKTVRALTPNITTRIRQFTAFVRPLPTLLGHERPMRYLVVFQNDNELRPTGGFIGSMGILDVSKGSVAKIFINPEGSYALQGALTENQRAPQPLQYVNARWEFQDANWWIDFRTSAQKLLWFWDNAGQPTVDGVIAINSGLFENILEVIGPVDFPLYGTTIDASNFFEKTQTAVEFGYDRVANTPKQFLRDLADTVLHEMEVRGDENAMPLFLTLLSAFDSKDIQIYLRDPSLQVHMEEAGIAGALEELGAYEDGLAVVHTNIGGEKTDRVIRDTVTHDAAIDADGTITNTVTLTRTHRGVEGDLFTGVPLSDYVRFLVPLGATLVSATGFTEPRRPREVPSRLFTADPAVLILENAPVLDGVQIFSESGRTAFGGFMTADPGTISTVTLRYTLPFHLTGDDERVYRFRVQRQAGVRGATIAHTVHAPDGWIVAQTAPRSLQHPTPLDRSRASLSVLKKNGISSEDN
jgi:hypothetical protein